MSNIPVTPGVGAIVSTETISGADYQRIKVIGGETGSTSVMSVTPDGAIKVSVIGTVTVGNHSVSGTIGASVIGVVPVAIVSGGTGGGSVSGTLNVGSMIGAVTLYAQPTAFTFGSPSVITGTTSVLVLAAPTATLRNHITHILVSNDAPVSTAVRIVDAGTVIYAGFAAASGGGFSATLPVPLRQPTSGLGLYAHTSTQASVLVSISGFTA